MSDNTHIAEQMANEARARRDTPAPQPDPLQEELIKTVMIANELAMNNPQPTLRDQFAMRAMQALLSITLLDSDNDVEWLDGELIASESYNYADAMMKARNTPNKEDE